MRNLVFFGVNAWFTLSRNVSSKNDWCSRYKNPHAV